MKSKILVALVAVVLIGVIIVAAFCGSAVVSKNKFLKELEQSKVTNSQGTYTINYKIFEDQDITFVTFYVTDSSGSVVFEPGGVWRAWDFKSVTFDENDNIIVYTGDTGETVYSLKGDGGEWEYDYSVNDDGWYY